jgi:hypothetical protein
MGKEKGELFLQAINLYTMVEEIHGNISVGVSEALANRL